MVIVSTYMAIVYLVTDKLHVLTMYILGLRSSWGTSRIRTSWSPSGHLLTPALSPFRGRALEATLVWRRLFIVLMTATHISPNVFSLPGFLTNVQWTSHYNTRQWQTFTLYITFIHTFTSSYYTSHSYVHSRLRFFISSALHGRLAALDSLCQIQYHSLGYFAYSWTTGNLFTFSELGYASLSPLIS